MSRSERLLKLFNGHMRALLTAKPRICMTIDSTYSWTCRNVKLPTAPLSQMPSREKHPRSDKMTTFRLPVLTMYSTSYLPTSSIAGTARCLHWILETPMQHDTFARGARELLTAILERYATDDDVSGTLKNCQLTDQGKPTRRSKIRFLLYRIGILDDAFTDFVESDMENVVELFRVFNDGTHGSSGRFTHSQLQSIRVRVEDAVSFLGNIVSGQAFQSD